MTRLALTLGMLLAILTACAGTGDATPVASADPTATRQAATLLTPPPEPRPLVFPDDEAPHEDMTEWWYFTGHLFDPDGNRYGFEFVIFQVIRGVFPPFYASHFAVTDNATGAFQYAERVGFDGRRETDGDFHLALDGWEAQGAGGEYVLRATMEGYAIDLRLTSKDEPVVHNNGIGYMDVGTAGGSYYYSRTDIDVEGTLTVGGQGLEVSGHAWMDRQWGNFILVDGGSWDWFSLRLDDGSDLMLFELRGVEDIGDPPDFGTLVRPDGEIVHLPEGSYTIEPLDHWTSVRSGATYPVAWRVTIPDEELELDVRAVMPDQELDTTASTGTIYWEGEVEIAGTSGGELVTGLGYVELTGYAIATFSP